jgi:hypothetical protein
MLYSAIVAIAILILLQMVFASWRLALLTFITLPSAVIGGVLAAYLGDPVISIGSIVGFVTVFGIAGAQRHSAGASLPAPREIRERAFRPGTGDPRRQGATRTDPDDDRGDRPRPYPARRSG